MFNTLGNSIPRNSLVGEWLLDGNDLDTSGNGNNGTATNVTWVKTDKGYQSQAGSFNGSSSQVVGTNGVMTTGNFSISMIITTGTWSTTKIYYQKGSGNNLSFYRTGNGSGFIQIYNGTPAQNTSIACNLNNNKTYNIIYTQIGTTGYCYINGQLHSSGTMQNGTSLDTYFYIGRYSGGSTYYFNGNIQSVRIYNVALTQDEIQTLYLEGQRKLGPTNIAKYPSLLSGLVGYWDMRGTAHNLVDGVAGTVTGATLTTDRFGNSNSAYSFNGTTQNIQIPDSNDFSPITTGVLSFFAWVRTTNVSGIGYKVIGSKYTSGTSSTSEWFLSASNTNQLVISGNGTNAVSVNQTITDGSWHLVGCCIRATGSKIYYEGNTIVSGNLNLGNDTNTVTRIGYFASSGASNEGWNGQIGECFFFNRELSADEVKLLYDLSSQDYIYPTSSYDLPNLQDGLLIHLNGSNNGITTLYDISGNGKNGTISSTPTYKRQGKKKTVSLSSQSVSWTSTSFTTSTCFEKVSGKWTLVVNPAYITTTGITSGTREVTDIRVYDRTLSTIEQEQLKYAGIGNFIY